MQSLHYQLIEEAKKSFRNTDHIMYVTYPVLKENRLLVKILEEIHDSTQKTIKAILNYESEMKRIKLYSDEKMNYHVFEQRCAARYGITEEELVSVRQIIALFNSHKSSPVEFSRQNSMVIMSDNLQTDSLTPLGLKNFLRVGKELIRKAEKAIFSGSEMHISTS